MRLSLKVVLAIIFTLSMYSCSDNNYISPVDVDISQKLPNREQKSNAIKVASKFLRSNGVLATNSDWARKATITDAFPVYLDGIKDVSYYECKVQTNGKDAGYILVNINQTDILIPEYTTEGNTPSETFANEIKTSVKNLKMFRHNWFRMLAEKKTARGLDDGKILIAKGFDGTGNLQSLAIELTKLGNKRTAFKSRVNKAGGVNPRFTKKGLFRYYHIDSIMIDSLKDIEGLNNNPQRAAIRWTNDYLNQNFTSGWHLPKWYQVKRVDNCLSGCGPLSVAMLYSYWHQFRGKTKLFNYRNLNAANSSYPAGSSYDDIKGPTFAIGGYCNANYGVDVTSTSLNDLENGGDRYGDLLGYNVHMDMDVGGDFTKGRHAYTEITNERPCVVLFDTDGNGRIDHAGPIEAVKFREIKYFWNWYNSEMWYLVNYASENPYRLWICVDSQTGSSTPEVRNDGNLYMNIY